MRVPITSGEIAIGEATKKELFDKIQGNDDDHEIRILANEGTASNTIPFGFYISDSGGVSDDVKEFRVPFNITITSVVLTVIEAGTAGTLEVDVPSDQGGSFATILSGGNLTRDDTDGDRSSVTSAGIAVADIDAGKFIRLDIKAIQTNMRDAIVEVTYTQR